MYGEATIESLEDLMIPHDGHSIQELDEDTLDQLELPTEKPKTAAEKSRLAELVTLKSMNKKLNATKSSIRSVSHGIQGLQKQIHDSGEKEEEKEKEKGDKQSQAQIVVSEADLHPFSVLGRSFRSLFYTRDENGRFKLARFGLFLMVFLIWFITEFVMWYVFPSLLMPTGSLIIKTATFSVALFMRQQCPATASTLMHPNFPSLFLLWFFDLSDRYGGPC
jgi:hypothetical protein